MAQNILLQSAARTASTATEWQTRSADERGAHFILAVSAAPGVETLTVIIEGRDALGNTYPLLTTAASAATGTRDYHVHPDSLETANVRAKDFLPDSWRVRVVHSSTGSFTYSLCANTMN